MSKSTISMYELFAIIPDAETARLYIEDRLWADGPRCPLYNGWSEHSVTIRPTFDGFNVQVSGVNRNDIKDYISEEFSNALDTLHNVFYFDDAENAQSEYEYLVERYPAYAIRLTSGCGSAEHVSTGSGYQPRWEVSADANGLYTFDNWPAAQDHACTLMRPIHNAALEVK